MKFIQFQGRDYEVEEDGRYLNSPHLVQYLTDLDEINLDPDLPEEIPLIGAYLDYLVSGEVQEGQIILKLIHNHDVFQDKIYAGKLEKYLPFIDLDEIENLKIPERLNFEIAYHLPLYLIQDNLLLNYEFIDNWLRYHRKIAWKDYELVIRENSQETVLHEFRGKKRRTCRLTMNNREKYVSSVSKFNYVPFQTYTQRALFYYHDRRGEEQNFKNGRKDGYHFKWNERGNITEKFEYKDGKII